MNTPKLETNRLILRKFNENDLKAFYDIFSDKEVNLYLPWFPVKKFKRSKRLLSRKIRFYLSKRTKICLRYLFKRK